MGAALPGTSDANTARILMIVTTLSERMETLEQERRIEKLRAEYLSVHPRSDLTNAIYNWRGGQNVVERYFADFMDTFATSPDLLVVQLIFIHAIVRPLTHVQQFQYIKAAYHQFVLKSPDSAKKEYRGIFQQIVEVVSKRESKWVEAQYLQALLNDIVLAYCQTPKNDKNYYDAVQQIVSLFQSFLKNKGHFGEIKIRYLFKPTETGKALLPCQLYEAMNELYTKDQSFANTQKILWHVKDLWLYPVIGENLNGLEKKDFVSACRIHAKFLAYSPLILETAPFFDLIAAEIDNFDIFCIITFGNQYDITIHEKLKKVLADAYYHYVVLNKRTELYKKLYKTVVDYYNKANRKILSPDLICFKDVLSELAAKMIHLEAVHLLLFFQLIPLDDLMPFCEALTQIHPKDNEKILMAASLAWRHPDDEELVVLKFSLLDAAVQCPPNEKLPQWLLDSIPKKSSGDLKYEDL